MAVTGAERAEPQASELHDVFISYSRADGGFVRDLQDALSARGRRPWVDWQDIAPTAEWMAEIEGAIDQADAVVYVLSADSVSSRVCSKEIEHALSANKRIVPILYRSVDGEAVPETIAKLNWIMATDGDLEGVVDKLILALDTDLERVRAHSRLLVRSREWEAGANKALLLRGSELSDAEALIGSSTDPAPTPDQTRFVVASRKAATGRQRGAIAIATVVALVAATLGVFAWNQRGQAIDQRDRAERAQRLAEHQTRIADSRALAVQATSVLKEQPDLAALLSVEAARTAPTAEALQAMHVVAQDTGWMARVLRAQSDVIFGLAFSPDGSLLASGSYDGTITLWDPRTGARVRGPFEANKYVQTLAFSPDGKLLASSGDRTVILWDPATGERVGQFDGPASTVYHVAFSPDGHTLGALVADGTIWRWDVASDETIGTPIRSPHGRFWDMAFSPDGRSIASSGTDGAVRLWDVTTGAQIGDPLLTHGGLVAAVGFSPDGGTLASTDGGGRVALWDPATGHLRATFRVSTDPLNDLAFSPDGSVLATGSDDGHVRLWDPRTRSEVGGTLAGQEGGTESLAFSPDGSLLASGSKSGNVVLWGPIGVHRSTRADVFAVDVSSAGIMATGDGFGVVSLWSPSGEPVGQPLKYRGTYVNTLGFSPNGRELAVGYSDGSVILWDPSTGKRRGAPLVAGTRGEMVIAFSLDGELLAAGSANHLVTVWDVSTRRMVWQQPVPATGFKGVQNVAFSPDGTLLASSDFGGKVRFWEPRSGEVAAQPIASSHVGDLHGLAFAPDGSLATGSVDGTISVWDPRSGKRIAGPLHDGTSTVTSLDFSSDGTVLASATQDGHVILWNAKAWQQIGAPIPGHGPVWSVRFSPEDRSVAWGASAGSTYILGEVTWSSEVKTLGARLCLVAGRDLTHAEWRKYLPAEPYRSTCPA